MKCHSKPCAAFDTLTRCFTIVFVYQPSSKCKIIWLQPNSILRLVLPTQSPAGNWPQIILNLYNILKVILILYIRWELNLYIILNVITFTFRGISLKTERKSIVIFCETKLNSKTTKMGEEPKRTIFSGHRISLEPNSSPEPSLSPASPAGVMKIVIKSIKELPELPDQVDHP